MRLLYVTSSFPFGRGEMFLLPELEALAGEGHEVLVLPLWGRGAVEVAPAGLWEIAGPGSLMSREIIGAAIGECLRRPTIAAGALRAGVTFASGRAAVTNVLVAGKALWAARMATARGVDHVHAFWATGPATLALMVSHLSGIPWSFTAHRWDVASPNLLPQKLRRAAGVRAISHATRSMIAAVVGGPPDASALLKKVRVVHLGISLPTTWRGPAEAPVFLCPAGLVPVKGHRVLLRAFAEVRRALPAAVLELAGDGPERGAIAQEIRALGLEGTVRMLGHVKHPELLARYADARVRAVVLASLDLSGGKHEGIPVSLMEAMGHGLPVIATTTGGIPELVTGATGLLVPPADPTALAEAMLTLGRSHALAATLGASGRRVVEANFDARRSANRLLRLATGLADKDLAC